MKKFLTITFAVLLAFVLVACGEAGNGGDTPSNTSAAATKVTITAQSKSVRVGRTVQLTAKVDPAGASQEVNWASNQPATAIVDDNGKVTGVAKGKAVITATSKSNDGVSGKITITVNDTSSSDIDMGGYEIKIAYSPGVEYELDPRMDTSNHPEYKPSPTRKYAAEAWNEVATKYNCTITVQGYPMEDYYSRFDYIVEQGKNNTTVYDIYWIPTNQISKCYTALMTMDDLYLLYANNTMNDADKLARTYAGNMYGWSYSSNEITSDDSVIAMNVNLFNKIGMDPSQEPALLFMQDKWSLEEFKEWCLDAQTKLNALSTGDDDKYYVICGRSSDWLRDLARASGIPLANLRTMDMNLTNPDVVAIADMIHDLYKAGCVDPSNATSHSSTRITSWRTGHALINTGSYYFVDYYNRWTEDLWGEGDDTLYGFVPWPYANGADHTTARWGTYTQDCYSMPKAINKKIEGALLKSDDVTPENIFKIWVECFTKSQEIMKADPQYNKKATDREKAASKWDTPASVDAFVYIQDGLPTIKDGGRDIGVFDPIKELRKYNGDTEEWEKLVAGYMLELTNYTTETDYVAAITPEIPNLIQTFVEKYN